MRASQSTGGLGAPSFIPPSASTRSSTASLSSLAATSTGGGSVENSVFTFPTPRRNNQRRPRGGRRRPPQPQRTATDVHREYQLLGLQTRLLLGTAALSFLLFLLFTLPLAALVGLTVMVTSLGACLLLATSLFKTRYQLEMLHPLGLVRYLPESIRAHLTEKSLHECLSPSGSIESLTSLHANASKESLSSCNSSSKGSISSMTQQQNRLELGRRPIHNRGGRKT